MVPDTPQGWIAAVGVIIATAFTFYKNYRDTMQAAPKASPVPPARHYTEQDVMAAYAEVRENYRELRDIVQRHHGMTKRGHVDLRNPPFGRGNRAGDGGRRQMRVGTVHQVRWPALGRDHAAERLGRGAGIQQTRKPFVALPDQGKHFGCKGQRQVA